MPAGQYTSFLQVVTQIGPERGEKTADFATRNHCRARTAWYASGTGLVNLCHHGQNGAEWTVQLTAHRGPGGQDYLPLALGNRWRYRWRHQASGAAAACASAESGRRRPGS